MKQVTEIAPLEEAGSPKVAAFHVQLVQHYKGHTRDSYFVLTARLNFMAAATGRPT